MWIAIIFFGAVVIYLIWGINDNVKKSQEKKKENNNIYEKGKQYRAIYSTKINHICGLPLAENSKCIIHLCDKQIVVEGTGEIFKLQLNRVTDMNLKNTSEVKNSISGAVGGYIMLGPIGAFIGGSTTDIHEFFIIIYKNKEEQEVCISFDMKDDMKSFGRIQKYIESFKNNITNKKEIEL